MPGDSEDDENAPAPAPPSRKRRAPPLPAPRASPAARAAARAPRRAPAPAPSPAPGDQAAAEADDTAIAGSPTGAQIEACILEILRSRAAGATCCPSEAARRLRPAAWRPLMEAARDAARRLAGRGLIQITQRGQVGGPGAARTRGRPAGPQPRRRAARRPPPLAPAHARLKPLPPSAFTSQAIDHAGPFKGPIRLRLVSAPKP